MGTPRTSSAQYNCIDLAYLSMRPPLCELEHVTSTLPCATCRHTPIVRALPSTRRLTVSITFAEHGLTFGSKLVQGAVAAVDVAYERAAPRLLPTDKRQELEARLSHCPLLTTHHTLPTAAYSIPRSLTTHCSLLTTRWPLLLT